MQGPTGVPPRQERSRASTGRVLEATTELVAEGGVDRVTVAEVARRSAVSVGAIYGRFGDKESLLMAVQARFLDGTRGAVADRLARMTGPGGAGTVRAVALGLVRLAVDVFEENEALIGQFMLAGTLGPRMREQADGAHAAVQVALGRAVAAHLSAVRHPRPELAVDLVARAVIATLERRVVSGPEFLSDKPVSWDDLADELGEFVVRYLGLS